jgi:hypothetical protein
MTLETTSTPTIQVKGTVQSVHCDVGSVSVDGTSHNIHIKTGQATVTGHTYGVISVRTGTVVINGVAHDPTVVRESSEAAPA